jgi:hypothetical protein
VVGERLLDEEQPLFGRRIDATGSGRIDEEGRDPRVAVRICVVDEDPGVRREVRVERDPEESPLATARDPVRDVEESRAGERAGSDDPDLAALLGDEDPAAAVARVDDGQRFDEAADDLIEADGEMIEVEGGA